MIPRGFRFCLASKARSILWCDLAVVRAVDTAEADTFRVLVVEDFDGVAVEDGDDGAGEVGSRYQTYRKEKP